MAASVFFSGRVGRCYDYADRALLGRAPATIAEVHALGRSVVGWQRTTMVRWSGSLDETGTWPRCAGQPGPPS